MLVTVTLTNSPLRTGNSAPRIVQDREVEFEQKSQQ